MFPALQDIGLAYDHEVAQKSSSFDVDQNRVALTFLQKFVNDCCTQNDTKVDAEAQRFVVTTSTLEDWLHRGDHPILAPMSFQVYAMWLFRIEKPQVRADDRRKRPRFIDIPFAAHYQLHTTHLQRIATEFRVPLFEGFTMPSSNVCAETAALYKQILLRPLAVLGGDEPEDIRVTAAFEPLIRPADGMPHSKAGAVAFSRNWMAFSAEQENHARRARQSFLDRYEYPSLWETAEVQQELHDMWLETSDDNSMGSAPDLDPPHCPDKNKPRARVAEYSALVGVDVAMNLEGIARARLERRPRQYQGDAEIHQAYIQATTGGGAGGDDEDFEARPEGAGLQPTKEFFEPLPWGITTQEDMSKVLKFGHRLRLTSFAKELLELPCMQVTPEVADAEGMPREDLPHGQQWRSQYVALTCSGQAEQATVARANKSHGRHTIVSLVFPSHAAVY